MQKSVSKSKVTLEGAAAESARENIRNCTIS
jgi:hypothetical protein